MRVSNSKLTGLMYSLHVPFVSKGGPKRKINTNLKFPTRKINEIKIVKNGRHRN